ncbi:MULTISPECIES: phosphopantetheine-binding protein [unclassified Streptomyces]|uniref:phosphopantetheine-binding protein n=1 Tax=unclassified Streptomyces TaxID=2593676 RepID=UPI002E2A965A|nr:phosphopantetheine-binding protein [Streptomyces sp. NBC_00223]
MTSAVSELPKRMPTHAVESLVCSLWGAYFGRPVDPDDDFFDLGGDSLAVLDIVLAARGHGLELRASQALRHSTPARLAEAVTMPSPGPAAPRRLLALVGAALDGDASSADGSATSADANGTTADANGTPADGSSTPTAPGGGNTRSPLFVIHSDSHRTAEQEALLRWELGRPVHGLRLPGLDGTVTDGPGIVRAARGVAEAVRERQPDGPVSIAGFGLGAVFACEAAHALQEAGRQVGLLALVSPALPGTAAPDRRALLAERVALLGARFGLEDGDGPGELLRQAHASGWFGDVASGAELVRMQAAWVELTAAVAGHRLGAVAAPALLAVDSARLAPAEEAWRPALASVEVCPLDHGLRSPAGALRDPRLAEALRGGCGA